MDFFSSRNRGLDTYLALGRATLSLSLAALEPHGDAPVHRECIIRGGNYCCAALCGDVRASRARCRVAKRKYRGCLSDGDGGGGGRGGGAGGKKPSEERNKLRNIIGLSYGRGCVVPV